MTITYDGQGLKHLVEDVVQLCKAGAQEQEIRKALLKAGCPKELVGIVILEARRQSKGQERDATKSGAKQESRRESIQFNNTTIKAEEGSRVITRQTLPKLELKTTTFGLFMHALAVLVLLWGFITTSSVETPTTMQQTVQALWQIKYVAYAIFFEVVALNCRTLES